MDHPAARIPSCQTSVRSACRYTKLLAISVSPALSRPPGVPGCTLKLMKDVAGAAHPPGPPLPGPTPPGPTPPGPTPPGPTPPGPTPSGPPPSRPPPEVLPSALAGALAAFVRHLRSERSLSPHTVRAYARDIASLLAYA